MDWISQSELLFLGGIMAMALTVVLTIVCLTVFIITGRKLKKKLDLEYGKPQR